MPPLCHDHAALGTAQNAQASGRLDPSAIGTSALVHVLEIVRPMKMGWREIASAGPRTGQLKRPAVEKRP